MTNIMQHYRDMKPCKPTHRHHNHPPQNLLKLKENVCDVMWLVVVVVVVVVVTSSDLPGA